MYLVENPVLQRELLVNLRMGRAFFLLLFYLGMLGLVLLLAWPQERQLDLTTNPEASQRLINLVFLGQYLLAALMAPSFAAGAITGEKERMSYEMLLASPLRPGAIVLGKLFASLCHLLLLIFASLPIVMLCLPLGGVSIYEALAAYFGLFVSVITFGMISLAASSYFRRTSASLLVSYLLILPLAMLAVFFWWALSDRGETRLLLTLTVFPGLAAILFIRLFRDTTARLLHPPDLGSGGKDVVDLEEESKDAVGLVIQSDQFPDRLFAPGKRNDLLADGANPVFDKEMRSEIFSQGTLMLRVVIQVSMLLAIPLMAFFLYVWPNMAPWYISYVVLFNLLVGPVFSAGTVTSERERETLDLLLTTMLTSGQILFAKLVSGLRSFERVDHVSVVAPAIGRGNGQHLLDARAGSAGIFGHRADGVRHDSDRGAVLFGGVPSDIHQPDDGLSGAHRVVHAAIGRDLLCGDIFQGHAGGGRADAGQLYQPVCRRLRFANRFGHAGHHARGGQLGVFCRL